MAGWDGEAEDEVPAVMVCLSEIPKSNQYAFHESFAIQGAHRSLK